MLAGRYFLNGQPGWRPGIGLGWDEILGGKVVLQQVGPTEFDPDYLAQAEREARRAARLVHPNMVKVLDVVRDDLTGTYWLVTEPAEGITLSELVRSRGRLIVEEAAALTHQAADALAAAHAVGMVHGGVEPESVLVGRLGRVKLGDFGIARLPVGATDPAGSTAYLAPEVAAGQARDHASDVWSLGATVLYALSGRTPYAVGGHSLRALDGAPDDLPRLPDAGSLTPLLRATLSTDPGQRWPMADVRDYLAESSAVVTRRMPVLLPRPSRWVAQEALAGVGEAPTLAPRPKRMPALASHSHGALAAMLVAILAAIATGATVIGFGNASDTTSASRVAAPPSASASPALPLNTPYSTTTLRPSPSPKGEPPVGSPGPRARSAKRVPLTTPSSSPSSSPVAFESSSSSSSGQGSGSGSSGSHSKQPPRSHHNPGHGTTPLPVLPTPVPLPLPTPVIPTLPVPPPVIIPPVDPTPDPL
jgi:serine/threonine protein kinase